jgi:hypothetical protein
MTTRQEQHWLVGHRNDTQSHMTVLEMLQSTVEAASRVRASAQVGPGSVAKKNSHACTSL